MQHMAFLVLQSRLEGDTEEESSGVKFHNLDGRHTHRGHRKHWIGRI